MPGQNKLSSQGTLTLSQWFNQNPLAGFKGWLHRSAVDLNQQATATKKQQQVDQTRCCNGWLQNFGVQEAVTQASLRPLDCQNMP